MLDENAISAFLTACEIHVFDPETLAPVARAVYHPDGTVDMHHADGASDRGTWGIENGMYWTRYEIFRNGTLNRFALDPVDRSTAQAYFSDGRRAFLQSHNASLPGAGP